MAKIKKNIFEKVKAELIDETKEYIKFRTNNVKKRFLRVGEASFLFLLGAILISFGLSFLLERYFPILSGGFGYLIVGAVLILTGLIIK